MFKRDRNSWEKVERGGKSRKRRHAERNTETLVVFQDEKIKGLGEHIRRRGFKSGYCQQHETENLSHSALTK